MELMDKRAQRWRAHAEEHPLNFVGQQTNDVGNDRQVAVMTGAATPAHARFTRGAAATAQAAHKCGANMFGTTRISWCMSRNASANGWVDTTTRSHRLMPSRPALHFVDDRACCGCERSLSAHRSHNHPARRSSCVGVLFEALSISFDPRLAIATLQHDDVGRLALDLDDRRRVVSGMPSRARPLPARSTAG